jgi:hypothetical protein
VSNWDGVAVFTTTNTDRLESLVRLEKGLHRFTLTIPGSFLALGNYSIIVCFCVPGFEVIDVVSDEIAFEIIDGVNHATKFHDDRRGVVTPLLDWTHHHDLDSR